MSFPFLIPISLSQDKQEMIEKQISAIENNEYGDNKRQTRDDRQTKTNDGGW